MGNVPRRGHGDNMIRSGPSVLDHTTPRPFVFHHHGVDLISWDWDIRRRSEGGLD
ncbi:unnamed protein product, partial [Musa banksii]